MLCLWQQLRLYEDFAKSRARKALEDGVKQLDDVSKAAAGKAQKKTSHIFQVTIATKRGFLLTSYTNMCPMPVP